MPEPIIYCSAPAAGYMYYPLKFFGACGGLLVLLVEFFGACSGLLYFITKYPVPATGYCISTRDTIRYIKGSWSQGVYVI